MTARPLVALGVSADREREFESANARFPALISSRSLSRLLSHQCATARQLAHAVQSDRARIARLHSSLGLFDTLGICASDPAGAALVLVAPLTRPERVGPQVRAIWSRVNAHLAAGLRLRRLLAATAAPPDAFAGAEAILDGRGRVQHAEEPAKPGAVREALRDAAVNLTRACGLLGRRDPAEAVAMWRALVAGRWTLLDHFDCDGKRYLIARRNEPQAPGPAQLSAREKQVVGYACLGHSNKLIGYELGLSPGTIAATLARAAAKLGVASRAELISTCTELALGNPHPS